MNHHFTINSLFQVRGGKLRTFQFISDVEFKIGDNLYFAPKMEHYQIIGIYKDGEISEYALLNVKNSTIGMTHTDIYVLIYLHFHSIG